MRRHHDLGLAWYLGRGARRRSEGGERAKKFVPIHEGKYDGGSDTWRSQTDTKRVIGGKEAKMRVYIGGKAI